MLRLVHGNRVESLADRLGRELSRPLAGPLTPEQVVVQNPGMAQWLTQHIALASGISANIEFPLPARFIWDLFEAQLPDVPPEDRYQRSVLAWHCAAALPGLTDEPGFDAVREYLRGHGAGDPDGRRLHRLCSRCAGLFDQYLVYRPEWIGCWDRGLEDHWQAVLWRAIAPPGPPRHRAALLAELLERASTGALDPAGLPQRVSVFGLSAVAPAYLAVLQAISAVVQVELYVLNPSRAYWGDIVAGREQARRRDEWRRLDQPDLSEYFQEGHPLLASLGGQGRDLFEQLQEAGCEDEALFAVPGEDTRLHRLQQDILALRDRRFEGRAPAASGAGDPSVQVHGAHGALREVQILQDRLLDLFEGVPGLTPRDIVVMAPDIAVYAPHVKAVFGTAPRGRFIPYSLADAEPLRDEPLAQGLLTLLALPAGRLEASMVMGLLDLPALRRRFGIGGQDLAEVHHWVEASAIRWGLDRADREAAGLPGLAQNTWRFGLDRLLLGYAMPDGAPPVRGTLPVAGIEGEGAERVGALVALVDTLAQWRRRLAGACTADGWRDRVGGLLDAFFDPTEEEVPTLQALRLLLDDLAREAEMAGAPVTLSPEVLRDTVEERLVGGDGSQGFLAGHVTFCNMVPMRSIPFRVVCLLGMNDGTFPRLEHPLGFDLMAAAPRPGDRSRRDDDRLLFLEALLCARDVFYLSYQSRDMGDNGERVPSVVLSDLMDYLRRAEPDGAPGLFLQHPLQPFSGRYFDVTPGLFSYGEQWAAAPVPPAPFFEAPLPPPEAGWRQVDLTDLTELFAGPARFLLRRRLGVHLREGEGTVEDSEPYALDGLQRYLLRAEVLADEEGRDALDAVALRRRLEAAGMAPHGPFADLAARQVLAPLAPMVAELGEVSAGPAGRVEVDLTLSGFRLTGWLEAVRPGGLIRYRPGRVRARDRLGLWIEHLALCAAAPAGVASQSRSLLLDGELGYGPVAEARPLLETLLALYWQGLTAPLAFFPETSWAYADARARGRDRAQGMGAARLRWHDGYAHRGEGDDPYIDTAWRGSDPFGPAFEEVAQAVYGPLIRHARGG